MAKKPDSETMQLRAHKAAVEKQVYEKAWNDDSIQKTLHKVMIGNSADMKMVEDYSVHLIVTSPPYFNAREYSQWKTVDDYVADMKKTFNECYRVLSPNRKFCLNISDLPEKGDSGVKWNPLGPRLLMACLDAGFELCVRIFWF